MASSGYPRLERLNIYQAMDAASATRADDIVVFTRLLVSLVGKDKAIELIKKARWSRYNKAGADRANALGNPKDLDTYVQDYLIENNSMPPFVHQGEVLERTKKMIKIRFPGCFIAKAIKAHPEADAETIEVICKGYCQHDQAYTKGFNPKITLTILRYAIVDPENKCDFQIEIEE